MNNWLLKHFSFLRNLVLWSMPLLLLAILHCSKPYPEVEVASEVSDPGFLQDIILSRYSSVTTDLRFIVDDRQLRDIYENSDYTTMSVRLSSRPSGTVVLAAQPLNNRLEVSPASLTFDQSNWESYQDFSIRAVDNNVIDGDNYHDVEFYVDSALSSDSSGYKNMGHFNYSVKVINDDTPSYILERSALTPISEAGGTTTFNLSLNSPPIGLLQLNLTSQNSAKAIVSPTVLAFDGGNWSNPQTVTITGVDNSLVDGNQPVRILMERDVATTAISEFNTMEPPVVEVTVSDDDRPPGCSSNGSDGYEPDNSEQCATYLQYDGVMQQHSIAPAGDVDYFSFDVNDTGKLYFFEITDGTGNCMGMDPILTIYDTDGITVIRSDDSSGIKNCSRLSYRFTAPGIYYLSVADDLLDSTQPEEFAYAIQITRPPYYVIETRKTANLEYADTVMMLYSDSSANQYITGCMSDGWDLGSIDDNSSCDSGFSRIICPKHLVTPGEHLLKIHDYNGYILQTDIFRGAYSISVYDSTQESGPCPASGNDPGDGLVIDPYEDIDDLLTNPTPLGIGCAFAQDHTLNPSDLDFFLINF